ncbi:type II secretion system protein GspM [Antarcticirhabdus aurantiaca]|uniref:Type II secretion system protein GspM n=1 Tax=Antarcticirhabdus aurantiaca TaxID=2606717 RepID=A0ACD4NLW2_9HYPH|nr:type II secretion system protein GspM [Antarcticirhabdus aurantiaca]WAJ27837.1 type II secretion system protein GspM [Jeongeuplla avenae]
MAALPLLERPLARRLAALLLLGLALVLFAPLVTGPVSDWQAKREAVAEERRVLDRIARLDARRAAVAALAARPDPPVLLAADRHGALAALSARVARAVPPGGLTLAANQPLDEGETVPGLPVRVMVQFTSTPAGFYAFVRELETKPPFVRVDSFSTALVSDPKSAEPALLAGSAELSLVPPIRAVAP